jgi:hypothetical protein
MTLRHHDMVFVHGRASEAAGFISVPSSKSAVAFSTLPVGKGYQAHL